MECGFCFFYYMNRRNFIKGGIACSAVSLLPGKVWAGTPAGMTEMPVMKPCRLSPGDTVGLIAPGYLLSEEQLQTSIQNLRQLGFKPYYTTRISGKYGYFSGTDKERAADINEMFENPEVKGIISAGGGYGCTRILNDIDYSKICRSPKVLMGFSDVTALLNAVTRQTGLVTFHGPVARTVHRTYNTAQFNNIILHPASNYLITGTADDWEKSVVDPVYERYTIFSGKAGGKLAGGNLSLVVSLIGTKYQLDLKNKILFLEDIDEEPYRIDRMLTQLLETGALQQLAGIVFGICKGCNKGTPANSFSLKEVILDRIKPLKIPAFYGLSFGHNINNGVLPIGLNAILDADRKTIRLTEPAVE